MRKEAFVDIISRVGIIEPTVAIKRDIERATGVFDSFTCSELKPTEYTIFSHAKLGLYSAAVASIMKILGTTSTVTLAYVTRGGKEYRVTAPVGALNNAIEAFLLQAVDWRQALRIAVGKHNRDFTEYAIQTDLMDDNEDVAKIIRETGLFSARNVSGKVYDNYDRIAASVSVFAETEIIRMIYAEYSRAIGNGTMSEPGIMDMYDTVRDVVAGFVRYLIDSADSELLPNGNQIQIKATWLKRLPTPTFDEVFGGKDVT